jgi:hypothetical protein
LDPISLTVSAVNWTISSVGQALISQLLEPPTGAYLTDEPVHLNRWVIWRQADKAVYRHGLAKVLKQVVKNVTATTDAYESLDNKEIDLVIDNVAQSLMAIEMLTMDQVQIANLDSWRLAEQIEAHAPPRKRYDKHVCRVLHNQIILECCDHLIDYFTSRPEFIARTLVEQSRNIADIREKIPDVKRHLHDYEQRYKEGVAALNDTIRLFGLGLPPSLQSYKLSTAYVSLSVRDNINIGEHSRIVTG